MSVVAIRDYTPALVLSLGSERHAGTYIESANICLARWHSSTTIYMSSQRDALRLHISWSNELTLWKMTGDIWRYSSSQSTVDSREAPCQAMSKGLSSLRRSFRALGRESLFSVAIYTVVINATFPLSVKQCKISGFSSYAE